MSANELYRSVLLDHFHHPRNKGDLSGADRVRRGSNPRCGDEVEVGVYLDGNLLERVGFRGRGCSVCMASASMMTEVVKGKRTDAARALCDSVHDWMDHLDANPAPPQGLEALMPVRDHPARKRCALLAWEALADAIDDL